MLLPKPLIIGAKQLVSNIRNKAKEEHLVESPQKEVAQPLLQHPDEESKDAEEFV